MRRLFRGLYGESGELTMGLFDLIHERKKALRQISVVILVVMKVAHTFATICMSAVPEITAMTTLRK